MAWIRLFGRLSISATSAVLVALAFVIVQSAAMRPVCAQSTVSSGSIQGNVVDPSGASVPGAKVTVTNKDTGQTEKLTTSSAGVYSTVALTPGTYTVRVESANFKTAELTVTVAVGVVTPGNVQLQLGASSTTVEVTSTGEQSTRNSRACKAC